MKQFLLVIISIIVIPLTIFLVISWTTVNSLTNQEVLKKTLDNDNIHQKIVEMLPEYLTQKEDAPVIFSDSEKGRIVQTALPTEEITKNVDKIITDFSLWLTNKKDTFEINVDFSQAKQNAKKEIETIYKEKYASLPVCSNSELLAMKIQSKNSDFPSCRTPSEGKYESVYKSFDPSVVTTDSLNSLPDKIEVKLPDNIQNLPKVFGQIRLFLQIATVIDIALLLIALLILFPYKKALIRYLGVVSLILGFLLVAYKYLVLDLLNSLITEKISASLQKAESLKNLVLPIYNTLIGDLKSTIYLASIATIATGVLAIIISSFIKKKIYIKQINEPNGTR